MKYAIILPSVKWDNIVVNPEKNISMETDNYIKEYINNQNILYNFEFVNFDCVTTRYTYDCGNDVLELVSPEKASNKDYERGDELRDIAYTIERFILVSFYEEDQKGNVNIFYMDKNNSVYRSSHLREKGVENSRGFDSVSKLEDECKYIEKINWELVLQKMKTFESLKNI